ncbi:MAG TPA: tRNA (adenosine(37)-N6)-threonylcarbamoyltransferase complex dimerization subunit type 1 TsaB [Pyrinomonadaceae bacterium]|nr:tRNA (adenosine(37)-N6)-threonylcarbamoyltransferase complex dimerization subunit type 1 TsaB [Pyrinomonadaceae bacterium]
MQVNSRPLILSIETATRAGSLALTRGRELLASWVGDAGSSHSTHLLEEIEKMLEEARVTLSQVDAFAVAAGPGSFTGLRIGLATVKSFAATLNRHCIGIPTLNAVALGAGESGGTIALLPAGRGEVFAQRFAVSGECVVQPFESPIHVRPDSLLDKIVSMRRLKWTGEGAQNYQEEIKARAQAEGINFVTADSKADVSDKDGWTLVRSTEALAASVSRLALARAPFDDTYTPQNLRAIYVRPSDAEINERCQA